MIRAGLAPGIAPGVVCLFRFNASGEASILEQLTPAEAQALAGVLLRCNPTEGSSMFPVPPGKTQATLYLQSHMSNGSLADTVPADTEISVLPPGPNIPPQATVQWLNKGIGQALAVAVASVPRPFTVTVKGFSPATGYEATMDVLFDAPPPVVVDGLQWNEGASVAS